MSGLVDQLQADALDDSVPLTTLLRKVRVAATKLALSDTLEWVTAELEGYRGDVPEYRKMSGRLQWLNPMRGWLPVSFGDNRMADMLQTWPVPEAVTSLEATLASNNATYVLPMPADVTNLLTQNIGFNVPSARCEFGRGALVGIVQHVRGLVLDWSLELERVGITGQGLSFSNREQATAQAAHVTIGTFQGSFNTGDASGINARINMASTDASHNGGNADSLFNSIKEAVLAAVPASTSREAILQANDELRVATSKETFLSAYNRLIASASNHITVLTPFLPALAAMIGAHSGQ